MSHSGSALINPIKILHKLAIKPGMRVADFGCGFLGHFIFPLSEMVGQDGIVYGVDIMKQALETVQKRARHEGKTNIQTIWSDIELYEKTPLPPENLDGVCLVNTLFLIQNKLSVLQEVARLLKKAGFVLIIDWEKKLCSVGPEISDMAIPTEIMDMAQKCGFKLEEKFLAGDCHYGLIFRKM